MHYFFATGIAGKKIVDLDERESHHAIHVLRLKAADHIHLLDGAGNEYEGEITVVSKKVVSVKIIHQHLQPKSRDYYLHVAIAPTKSTDRFDVFLEKATEIGIDEVTPLITQNSERRFLNNEKAGQTLVTAIKQSGNAWLPKLNEAVDIKTFFRSQQSFSGQRIICHCQPGEKTPLHKSYSLLNDVLVMIGPEGDFTVDEVNLSIEQKFIPATLGDNRLRTETAGLLVCAMIKTIHEIQQ